MATLPWSVLCSIGVHHGVHIRLYLSHNVCLRLDCLVHGTARVPIDEAFGANDKDESMSLVLYSLML
jgi:hypothetical protein